MSDYIFHELPLQCYEQVYDKQGYITESDIVRQKNCGSFLIPKYIYVDFTELKFVPEILQLGPSFKWIVSCPGFRSLTMNKWWINIRIVYLRQFRFISNPFFFSHIIKILRDLIHPYFLNRKWIELNKHNIVLHAVNRKILKARRRRNLFFQPPLNKFTFNYYISTINYWVNRIVKTTSTELSSN